MFQLVNAMRKPCRVSNCIQFIGCIKVSKDVPKGCSLHGKQHNNSQKLGKDPPDIFFAKTTKHTVGSIFWNPLSKSNGIVTKGIQMEK